jgi:hypothetical protein
MRARRGGATRRAFESQTGCPLRFQPSPPTSKTRNSGGSSVLALNQRIFTSGTCPFPLPAEGHSLPSVSLHAKEPAIRLAVRADRDAVSFAARQWLARNQDDRAVGIQDAARSRLGSFARVGIRGSIKGAAHEILMSCFDGMCRHLDIEPPSQLQSYRNAGRSRVTWAT